MLFKLLHEQSTDTVRLSPGVFIGMKKKMKSEYTIFYAYKLYHLHFNNFENLSRVSSTGNWIARNRVCLTTYQQKKKLIVKNVVVGMWPKTKTISEMRRDYVNISIHSPKYRYFT